jgi:transposase-like protein
MHGHRPFAHFYRNVFGHVPVGDPLERIMREIRRRTRVVGAFPDDNTALNLAEP